MLPTSLLCELEVAAPRLLPLTDGLAAADDTSSAVTARLSGTALPRAEFSMPLSARAPGGRSSISWALGCA